MKDTIRIGDTVKILNPEFFIRCGYPLSIKDGIRMILNDEEGLKSLEKGIDAVLDRKNLSEDENLSSIFSMSTKSSIYPTRSTKDFYNILKILAYYKIHKIGFGGKERKIYTKRVEEAKNHEFTVLRKKIVVTGKYIPGSRSSRSYYDYEDYDPPYLDNSKSHVILYIQDGSVDGDFFYVNNCVHPLLSEEWKLADDSIDDIWPLAIEKCNVEKVREINSDSMIFKKNCDKENSLIK